MSEKKLSRKNFEEALLDITFFKKNIKKCQLSYC